MVARADLLVVRVIDTDGQPFLVGDVHMELLGLLGEPAHIDAMVDHVENPVSREAASMALATAFFFSKSFPKKGRHQYGYGRRAYDGVRIITSKNLGTLDLWGGCEYLEWEGQRNPG